MGDRWIGVALSDPGEVLATPLVNIDRKAQADEIVTLSELVHKHEVGKVIVGLPRSMDGNIREQAQKVIEFVARLSSAVSVSIEYRDERLSTVSASRFIREASPKRRGNKPRDDSAAAAIILQGFLDQMRFESSEQSQSLNARPDDV